MGLQEIRNKKMGLQEIKNKKMGLQEIPVANSTCLLTERILVTKGYGNIRKEPYWFFSK